MAFLTAIYWVDVLVVMLMAFSFIRQFLALFPEQFGLMSNLIMKYINLNLFFLLSFSLYITFAVATMMHIILSYFLFGLDSYAYSLINTMIVFIDGFSIYNS